MDTTHLLTANSQTRRLLEAARSQKLQKLRRLSLIAGILHLIQGIIVLWLSQHLTIAITGSYLQFSRSARMLKPATTTIFRVDLPWLIALFFFLSAFFHLVIVSVYNKRYNINLRRGINKARWVEYSLSASVMMVAIAMLVGVYDLASLLMLFGLTAIMNLMGLMMELHNQTTPATNWTSYYIGCLAGALPWGVVALYLWLGATYGSRAPTFVYWIFVSLFVFFSCFAVNMLLQYKKIGPWKDYLYGERVYILLSLVAKSLLAWQVFAGTLRP